MALTRFELGELYHTKGGVLQRRFLGTVLHIAQQIIGGGIPTPTAEQTAWSAAVVGSTHADHDTQARAALEWGLVNNVDLQTNGEAVVDTDLDFIVAEYAKTYS